ncbi:glycine receptor subunit alpha-3-like isoform X2 [Amphiura filiformis]|uniref:glycine receptor subunit alpha-3-like isoform X2 n=1 Tax=Amphiura filiformis TaxID=82378 RepID=UPI003B20E823
MIYWKYDIILLLVTLCTRIANATDNSTRALNKILLDYDKKIRPDQEGPPTTVTIGVYVESLGSIRETTMDFSVTMFLRQTWTDPRLAHGGNEEVIFKGDDTEKFWYPDIFFLYEKNSVKHDVTIRNVGMRVRSDGEVFRSARLTVTLACNMDLYEFPMDSQNCDIFMMSYAYPTSELILTIPQTEVFVEPNITIPRFTLKGVKTRNTELVYSTGNFSCAQATLSLERQMQSYVLTVYVPNLLLVIIAWLSFWIDAEAAPARVALGVTTILTVTTMTTNIQETLPVVTYTKAIDVWQVACLIFVFLSLLEYSFANYLLVLQVKSQRTSYSIRKLDEDSQQTRKAPALSKIERNEDGNVTTYRPALAQKEPRLSSHQLDKLARIVYPGAFVLFNVFYWAYYLIN